MKKILISTLVALILAISAFATMLLVVNAETPTPEMNIAYCNLSLRDSVAIRYAVRSNVSDVKLLIWYEAQDEYVIGTQAETLTKYSTEKISGVEHCVFDFTSLRAKQMGDVVYARAYSEKDGVSYYSSVSKYSILQYAYNKLGKTGTASTDTKLTEMLTEMLQYGAAAQKYLNYKTDRLVTAPWYQVKVTAGTLSDGSTDGLFLAGDKVTLIAPETNADGWDFSCWKDSAGNEVTTEATFELTVGNANEVYTPVYTEPYSKGLEYTLNSDGQSYSVTGVGTCADANVVIPTVYNGLPVTSIADEAFWKCTGITSIDLPNSITSLGSCVFYGCTSLTSINYNGTMEQWQAIEKGSDWDYKTQEYTISYADGKATKDEVDAETVNAKLAALQEACEEAFDAEFYGEVEKSEVSRIYEDAYVAILNANTVEAMDKIIADMVAELKELPKADAKFIAVMAEIEKDGITSPEDDKLVKEAGELAVQLGDHAAYEDWADMYKAVTEYGDEKIDLLAKFVKVYEDWFKAFIQARAEDIKADMEAIAELDVTLDIAEDVVKIAELYAEWVKLVGENYEAEVAKVNGFARAIADFGEVTARVAVLEEAKEAAKELNKEIAEFRDEKVTATTAFKNEIAAAKAAVKAWAKAYDIQYDAEEKDYLEANYKMAAVDVIAAIEADFAAAVAETVKAFEAFTTAVDAIGDEVTANSNALIQAAWTAYTEAKKATKNNGFDAVLVVEGTKTIAQYYDELQVLDGEYVGIMVHVNNIKKLVDKYGSVKVQTTFSDVKDSKGNVIKTAAQVQKEYEDNLKAAKDAVATIESEVEQLVGKKEDGGHAQDKALYPDANTAAKVASIELVYAQYFGYVEVNAKYAEYKAIEGLNEIQYENLLAAKNVLISIIFVQTTAEEVALVDIVGTFEDALVAGGR